jgi:hypothetical protein
VVGQSSLAEAASMPSMDAQHSEKRKIAICDELTTSRSQLQPKSSHQGATLSSSQPGGPQHAANIDTRNWLATDCAKLVDSHYNWGRNKEHFHNTKRSWQ